MESDTFYTVVEMPDARSLAVEYYLKDDQLKENEKQERTQLFIQLDDCLCVMKINKSDAAKTHVLERIVHNKVINERGHLC